MLTARDLGITLAERPLVAGLSVEMASGQCWAVLGRNGAGKTSLLLTLAGLRTASHGSVELAGRPLQAWPARERARQIGILMQDETTDYWGSTLEYVMLGRYPRIRAAVADDASASEAAALIAEFDLGAHAAQPFRTLSGGERQRARIAQTLMQDTACVLLDEPLQHLDLKHQLTVMQALSRRAAAGRAIMMALHEPAMAARHCDRALLLYDSSRVRHGRIEDMLTQDNLEALYQCHLEPAGGPGMQAFIPR